MAHTLKSEWLSINLTRLFISLRQLRVAMEQTTSGTHLESLLQYNERFSVHHGFLNDIVGELSHLCDKTMKDFGRVRVRYLHDLKPTDYGTDVHFFHLTDAASKDDMVELLRSSLAKPGPEGITKLVNLSLVRDVEIRLHSTKVSDIHHDYSVVYKAHQDFKFLMEQSLSEGAIWLEVIKDAA